jgi:glutathione S-transferase
MAQAEYQLYCFAQSGNAYRAALMLNLIGADWQPVYVDFFKGGETRTPKYRTEVNEMGEVPVLAHGTRKLSQSGVILTYLAEHTGRFKPDNEDARLEALRWIIFDNQKVNGFLGPYRFLKNFARPAGDPAVLAFLKAASTAISGSSISGLRRRRSCWAMNRPSPTSRSPAISIIRQRSLASISPRSSKTSAPGVIA